MENQSDEDVNASAYNYHEADRVRRISDRRVIDMAKHIPMQNNFQTWFWSKQRSSEEVGVVLSSVSIETNYVKPMDNGQKVARFRQD